MKRKLKVRNHFKRKSAAVSKRTATRHGAGHAPHGEHGRSPEEEHEEFKRVLASDRPEEAVALARSFTRRWPQSATAWACRGAAAFTLGDYVEEATRYFKKAIALDPSSVGGWTGLIDCLLARPDTRGEAFAHMHKMHESPAVQRTLHLPGDWCEGFNREAVLARLWNGAPTDTPIFLWLDGGAGDSFLQSRFASLLRERCPRVIVSGGLDTAAVLRTCPGVDDVMEESEWAEHPDLRDSQWISGRMALARFYADTPPPRYLFADAQHVTKWEQRVASKNLKVALVWKGGPITSFGQRRDCELSEFGPLGQVQGVDFYSIQKGEAQDDPAPPGLQLRRLSDDLHDWADTAAALATMDVLVSVDTGPLHLAAALDVPVWSLLTAEYWSFIYRDGIFYPSMRVFRKKMSEPWKPLMEEVAAALGVLARKHADDALAYEVA